MGCWFNGIDYGFFRLVAYDKVRSRSAASGSAVESNDGYRLRWENDGKKLYG